MFYGCDLTGVSVDLSSKIFIPDEKSLTLMAQRCSTAPQQIILFTASLHEKSPNRIWLTCVMTENINTDSRWKSIIGFRARARTQHVFICYETWCKCSSCDYAEDQSIPRQTTDQGNKNSYGKIYAPLPADGFSRISASLPSNTAEVIPCEIGFSGHRVKKKEEKKQVKCLVGP